ncbi:alpha/beta hydrolase [Cohnella algarum]|uniref:alpha/beta hydrolase n=1 Tax=Cohnella algarum TaxID=2044859 RepID=UPI001968842C|nr:alpha/beta hydrolase [Cohnella algarum]MBN2984588.1 alpha/beta hydrolase [Cohnella algarum]
MIIEKISLWDDADYVQLHAYVLNNSPEFQADRKRPAVVICPGGAYLRTSDREAEPVALRFAAQGYHAFVLRYTTYFNKRISDFAELPQGNPRSALPQPLFDLVKAILTIKERADEWLVDADRIAVCGFSAGGHLAASLGVYWHESFLREKFGGDASRWRPNVLVLGYPLTDYPALLSGMNEADETTKSVWELAGLASFGTSVPDERLLDRWSPALHVSERTPPAFIWHTADDGLVYVSNALNFAAAMSRHKVPFELHVFESGVHGLALADETSAGGSAHINPAVQPWVDLAMRWLKRRFE